MADDRLATAALAQLAERRPDVVALARAASVATVIEPALLRRLRLEIPAIAGPGRALDAGAEADLWFSRLAHVATAGQLTLRPAVAELLRAELSEPQHNEIARAARQIVAAAHASHPDVVQLEERIIWSAITGDTDDIGRALNRARAAIGLGPDRAAEVVRWIMQARRRLPAAALRHPAGQKLLAAVAMHTDRIVPAEVLRASRFPDAVGDVAPAGLPLTTVGVELMAGGIRFSSPSSNPAAAMLTLPDTRPLVLEARWTDAQSEQRSNVIIAEPGTATTLAGLTGPVVLRTLAGARSELSLTQAREVTVAVFGLEPIALPTGLPDVTIRLSYQPVDLYDSKPEVLVIGIGAYAAAVEYWAAFRRAAERARLQAGTPAPPAAVINVAPAISSPGPYGMGVPSAYEQDLLEPINTDLSSVSDTIVAAIRNVVEHPGRMYQLDLPTALAMLQALALMFHVRGFYNEEVGDEASEERLFDLTEDPARRLGERSAETFLHVRTLCEWIFAGPVRDYIDGGEDPTQAPPAAATEYESDRRDAAGHRFYDPGWAPDRGRWASFDEYLNWFGERFHHYAEVMRDRLAPRTVINRYPVPVDALESCRLALGTAALPLGQDQAVPGPREQETVFAVDRARLPALISALAVPVLAAVAASRAEREADPATRPYLEPAPGVAVRSVMFFPDGQRLATAGADRLARIWDVAARRQVTVLRGIQADLLAIAPDGERMATADSYGTLEIWDAAIGKRGAQWPLSGPTSRPEEASVLSALAVAPDRIWLAAGGTEGRLVSWDSELTESRVFTGRVIAPVSALAVAPDGTWLAAASGVGVQILDVDSGQQLRFLGDKPPADARAVAIAPDGSRLAVGEGSSLIKIWDPATESVLAVLTGHTGPVNTVAISPDARVIASGSDDQSVRIWDAASADAIGVFSGHSGPVNSVAFSPDGATLASAGSDGTVRFWDVPLDIR
jgi:WD40 repeat protein